MRTGISTYTHTCTIRQGDMAGNRLMREVKPWEYEHMYTCDHCGEPLVTTEQLLAHIYRELTE